MCSRVSAALLFVGLLYLPAVFAQKTCVKDYLNENVCLDHAAQRIVALAPNIVENLFSAGAGRQIVGAVEYSDFPPQAKNIPRVGAISDFSVEAIVALKPDLVVAWYTGRAIKIVQPLKQLGIPVYAANPMAIADISRSVRDYGILSGHAEHAEAAARAFQQGIAALRQKYSSAPVVTVFYQVWHQPLQTLNGQHSISRAIELCGGYNVFSQEPALAPKVSLESVLLANPEVILISGTGQTLSPNAHPWHKWKNLHAVAQDNIYNISADHIQRHSVRFLDGTQRVCEALEKSRGKRTQNQGE